jgi:hypothetical protein
VHKRERVSASVAPSPRVPIDIRLIGEDRCGI